MKKIIEESQKTVVYFTKNKQNKICVYKEIVDFKSNDLLEGILSQRQFQTSDEKFYLIFDIY